MIAQAGIVVLPARPDAAPTIPRVQWDRTAGAQSGAHTDPPSRTAEPNTCRRKPAMAVKVIRGSEPHPRRSEKPKMDASMCRGESLQVSSWWWKPMHPPNPYPSR